MVKSFVNNGWCVQIRGPQAGGAVADLPIHLYDLGTGNQVKIPSEVMIPETREFEFANLGFIRSLIIRIAITPASSQRTLPRNRRCMIPLTPPPTVVLTPVCPIFSCCPALRIT